VRSNAPPSLYGTAIPPSSKTTFSRPALDCRLTSPEGTPSVWPKPPGFGSSLSTFYSRLSTDDSRLISSRAAQSRKMGSDPFSWVKGTGSNAPWGQSACPLYPGSDLFALPAQPPPCKPHPTPLFPPLFKSRRDDSLLAGWRQPPVRERPNPSPSSSLSPEGGDRTLPHHPPRCIFLKEKRHLTLWAYYDALENQGETEPAIHYDERHSPGNRWLSLLYPHEYIFGNGSGGPGTVFGPIPLPEGTRPW